MAKDDSVECREIVIMFLWPYNITSHGGTCVLGLHSYIKHPPSSGVNTSHRLL